MNQFALGEESLGAMVPAPMLFYAYLEILDEEARDFPRNSRAWPLMSKRMYDLVAGLGPFEHTAHEAVLLDDTVLDAVERWSAGILPAAAVRSNYRVVEVVPVVELIDWDASKYVPDEFEPDAYYQFNELVLKSAPSLPPLFRVRGLEELFVSSVAMDALDHAGLTGLRFKRPDLLFPGVAASLRPGGGATTAPGRPRQIGYFRDLGFGNKWPESTRRASPHPQKAELLGYLSSAPVSAYSPGLVDDAFDSTQRGVATNNTRTDGVYVWPEVLAYYVERYDIELPAEFVEHAERSRWHIPADADPWA